MSCLHSHSPSVGKENQDMATKMSQSEKIRRMAYKGEKPGAIAKKLGIRYQTVWRTLHRPFQGVIPAEVIEANATAAEPGNDGEVAEETLVLEGDGDTVEVPIADAVEEPETEEVTA